MMTATLTFNDSTSGELISNKPPLRPAKAPGRRTPNLVVLQLVERVGVWFRSVELVFSISTSSPLPVHKDQAMR